MLIIHFEVTPLVKGEASDVVAHFTMLSNFKPIEEGNVSATLTIGLALLTKAFEKGELPLLNYLLEQNHWFTAYDFLLQVQRDLALIVAELNAWKL